MGRTHRPPGVPGLSIALAAASLVQGATPASGQDFVTIESDAACASCGLSLTHMVTLGSLDDPSVGFTKSVAIESSGRILVLGHEVTPHELMVFDPEGAFVRVIGRDGEGPGEFSFVMTGALTTGDSLHLFDDDLLRETVLTPTFDVARTLRLPVRVRETVFLDDGRIVVQSSMATPDLVGHPLHLLDRERNIVKSFGSADQVIRPDMSIYRLRRIEKADESSVWSAFVNQYVIENWSIDGVRLAALKRDVPWFEPWHYNKGLSLSEPPDVTLEAIRQDDEGRLWILIRVPGEDWKNGLAEVDTPEGRFVGTRDWDLAYDTVVEIIDPRLGVLVHSERVEPSLVGFASMGQAIGYREGPDGVPYIDLWQLELVEVPSSP
ncbi:6-bladed beta-propeller [Candidatus Palauibacter sp.]|uniref:6-bladed beta-propeller n=1 Tax=Candidatus Palauibacter sp. TaxID=3101350 RepID=UPI003B52B24D